MDAVSSSLVNTLAAGANPTAEAYNQRTEQLDATRMASEKQADADMLRVFEFAGDGHVDEARFYAQQKGLQVPDQVYSNADFAKGLTLAGKIYGDSPEQAQKFTQAWVSNPQGDFNTRLTAAQQAAGAAVNPEDRQLQKQIALESWKMKHRPPGEADKPRIMEVNGTLVSVSPDGKAATPVYSGSPKQPDYTDIGMKAYNAGVGGMADDPNKTATDAVALAKQLYEQNNQTQGAPQVPSPGLVGSPAPVASPTAAAPSAPAATPQNPIVNSPAPAAPAASQPVPKEVVRKAMDAGYQPEKIKAKLVASGYNAEQADALIQSATQMGPQVPISYP